MNSPLVSICIPTYNGEKYLKECLDSCIDQTFKNYEIIICDDCSSDGTIKIIEEYAKIFPQIILFQNDENLGLVGNWNRCIHHSNGEWIKFVFQDDYITKDCLDKFVQKINDSTQLIVCKRNFKLPHNPTADFVNYYTNVVRTLENTTAFKGNIFSPELISKIAIENICLNFIGEPSLIFFRKNITKQVSNFNPSLKQICDLEFTLRIASKYGLTYLREQLCTFRIHQNSTTSKNVDEKYFEIHYLEPILFSHELLYNNNFESLRSHLNLFQKFKLNLYFRIKTHRAYEVNLKEKREHFLFTDENKEFKKILDYKKGNVLIKFISAILN